MAPAAPPGGGGRSNAPATESTTGAVPTCHRTGGRVWGLCVVGMPFSAAWSCRVERARTWSMLCASTILVVLMTSSTPDICTRSVEVRRTNSPARHQRCRTQRWTDRSVGGPRAPGSPWRGQAGSVGCRGRWCPGASLLPRPSLKKELSIPAHHQWSCQ